MHNLILIFAIVAAESIAQYNIKKYQEIPLKHYYILGLLFYGIIVFLLNKTYSTKTSMGITQILWSGLSCISILMLGKFFFGEEIDKYEWLGICLILLGVTITQIKK